MSFVATIDDATLATVGGGGVWNGLDSTISYVHPSWRDKTCASRGATVGGFVDAGLGAVGWAAWKKTGWIGRAIIEPSIVAAAGLAQSSYIDNCDAQKGRGVAAKK
jgi:hypothetical protein